VRAFPFPNFRRDLKADNIISVQESLAYFLENLALPRRSMGHFSVLVLPLGDSQPLWLTQVWHEGDNILGKVAWAPGRPSLIGQHYQTSLKSIVDWLFVHNYRLIGATSFRDRVARTLAYREELVRPTRRGSILPNLPEPSEEENGYFNKIIKYCLPLDEESRYGSLFELFDAIGNHEPEAVGQLLSERRLIDASCEVVTWRIVDVHRKTLTPLLYAIKCKNEAAAVALIEAGARLDLQDDLGMTALHHSVPDFPALVRLLIENGASLKARNSLGLTPLDVALAGCRHESLHILIEAGADVNDYHELVLPNSTLRVVVSPVLSGGLDLESAKILSEAGANFDVVDNNGESAVHIAAINSRFDLAEYLVSLGCDPTARSNEGETPVSLALSKGSADALKFVNYCKKHCTK
jgi:hypothetical protein